MTKNPRRVAAGRMNRAKRGGLSSEGKRRLHEAINRNKPWQKSTGPITENGKNQAILNGKIRQLGQRSVREIRLEMMVISQLVLAMRATRELLLERGSLER